MTRTDTLLRMVTEAYELPEDFMGWVTQSDFVALQFEAALFEALEYCWSGEHWRDA